MKSNAVRTIGVLLALLAACSSAGAGVEAVEGGVRFTYADPNAGAVFLAGAFNNWSAEANPLTLGEDGVWSAVVPLGEGKHEYKLVVDGQWFADPDNPVTAGEYGNSVVQVGSGGEIVTMAATANTGYSAKIFLGGRVISRFISRENDDRGGRMELERPYMDVDLDWLIRANDYLDLHLLTSINNENEETVTDFWKTNLRFDRGSLRLHTEDFSLKMFDNESAGRFDDPLTLVGGIGIYDHDFGYRQQGAIGSFGLGALDLTFLYADDFENGGTSVTTLDSLGVAETGTLFDSTLSTEHRPGAFRFDRAEAVTYDIYDDDNDKDIMAVRAGMPVRDLRLGFSARLDRGYNPGTLSLVRADSADAAGAGGIQTKYGKTWERWWGAGGDLVYGAGEKPFALRFEVLHGRAEVRATDGREADVEVRTNGEAEATPGDSVYTAGLATISEERIAGDAEFEIDRSTRVFLGGEYRFEKSGLRLSADYEREEHRQTYYATGIRDTIENVMSVYRFAADQGLERFLGRKWNLGLEVSVYDFWYDARTPWRNQFWFDERNFWLEQSEHEISLDRLVLVGGRNASFVRPELSTVLYAPKNLTFAWKGTFAGIDLDKDPKYTENLFQFKAYPAKRFRVYSDTRLVKYTNPVLDLFGSYWCTFAEVAYEIASGIEVALSYGVDPYIVDETTNEYDSVGRDLFLFARGANGDEARRSFLGLATAVPAAEQALEDERR
ncbi:MAG: glycogen-binding domain-containing protein, partial [Candidatus Eisenbacteria bacterium]